MYLSNVFSSKSYSSQRNTGVSVTRGPNTPEKRTTKISKNLSYLLKVFLISNCSPSRHFVLLGFFFVCLLFNSIFYHVLTGFSFKKKFSQGKSYYPFDNSACSTARRLYYHLRHSAHSQCTGQCAALDRLHRCYTGSSKFWKTQPTAFTLFHASWLTCLVSLQILMN